VQGKESEATVLMHAHGWSRAQLARVLGCGETHVWKYLNGHRRVSPVQASKLESEFGADAVAFVASCRSSWTLRSEIVRARAKPRRKRADPWKPIGRAADEDWDGKLYPIEEWKRLFGQPGSSQGASGRVEGFFPTEPCFIGE
jgi:transcriptional regulator with XRE-family HTH domain